MIIFIDESGDPGFQIHRGSSPVFVIALVIFDDELEAEKCAVALKDFRRRLKFPDTVEFKFHKSRHIIKKGFLETATSFKFRVRAIIAKKEKILSLKLKTDKETFFNYLVRMVLQNHNDTIKMAKLKFDRRGEKLLRNQLRIYLSRELDNKNNKIFKNLKFVDSKENILIQLADMVAGAIASAYKLKDKRYLEILKNRRRVQDIWEFK